MDDFLGSTPVICVNGFSLDRLRYVLKLARGFPAHGYRIDKEQGCLVLIKYADQRDTIPFPAPLSSDRCAELAFEWLSAQDYPEEPDHDGSNTKGWLVSVDRWGHVEGHGHESFLSIRPQWIEYGK